MVLSPGLALGGDQRDSRPSPLIPSSTAEIHPDATLTSSLTLVARSELLLSEQLAPKVVASPALVVRESASLLL